MPVYQLQPPDLLFFRDARPMEPQSPGGGHGATWPHPAVIFDAIHAALWRAFPDSNDRRTQGFQNHHFIRKQAGLRRAVLEKAVWFQSLATAGPFPIYKGEWRFAAPADVLARGVCSAPVPADPSRTNAPGFLKYLLTPQVPGTKDPLPTWWSRAAYADYTAGKPPRVDQMLHDQNLFDSEWTTGIGTDETTGTQDGERIYSAQYLRLHRDTQLGIWASLPESAGFDGMERLFPGNAASHRVIVGGQQRPCHVVPQPGADLARLLPLSAPCPEGCRRLRWTLLSPAIFPAVPQQSNHPGGWLPTWIDARDGTVLLNAIDKTTPTGRPVPRHERRHVCEPGLLRGCRLVAACVPKPLTISGWTRALHAPDVPPTHPGGPRATLLAVPAGSVYYFEAEGPDGPAAIRSLWELLSWHGNQTSSVDRIRYRRSSLLGEKGFGIGVCSAWSPAESASSTPSPRT